MILGSLFELGKTAMLFFLINDYLIKNYPEKYNKFLMDIAFNVIYTYSYCQILFNKGISYIEVKTPFLIELFKNNGKKVSTIHFVKDNSVTALSFTNSFLNKLDFKIPEHNFIVYIDGETTPNNIKIIRNADILNEKIQFEKSNIKFMLAECIIDGKIYIIEFSNEKYNFYVKDNIFDKQFFLYYLSNIHPDKINIQENAFQTDDIILNIIDHNVEIKTILLKNDNNQYIKLNETSYEIITQV